MFYNALSGLWIDVVRTKGIFLGVTAKLIESIYFTFVQIRLEQLPLVFWPEQWQNQLFIPQIWLDIGKFSM